MGSVSLRLWRWRRDNLRWDWWWWSGGSLALDDGGRDGLEDSAPGVVSVDGWNWLDGIDADSRIATAWVGSVGSLCARMASVHACELLVNIPMTAGRGVLEDDLPVTEAQSQVGSKIQYRFSSTSNGTWHDAELPNLLLTVLTGALALSFLVLEKRHFIVRMLYAYAYAYEVCLCAEDSTYRRV